MNQVTFLKPLFPATVRSHFTAPTTGNWVSGYTSRTSHVCTWQKAEADNISFLAARSRTVGRGHHENAMGPGVPNSQYYLWRFTISSSVKKLEITAVGIRRSDHATPIYPPKLALTSPTRGGRSVGIVRSRTKATDLLLQWNLYKAEPHGTVNIFHIGQISALYKINNTDPSGRNYRICSHWANFRLIQVPPYTSFTVLLLLLLLLYLLQYETASVV
jgi:hypothetical protein